MQTEEIKNWPPQPDPSWPYAPLYDGLTAIFNKAIVLRSQITNIEEPNAQTDKKVAAQLTEISGLVNGLVDSFGAEINAH
ncbi:hypothetical protein NIES2119_09895 [[Phormidium ambiguum] IAM M-71]|uniref:Uncharacterized protein n=1 Tax=[Phormidium ambiguum] IAM M-71 TaxID=454136 RepID=A0A1U7IM18_9CYAN|nr:hypothetical protein [Phormidium ambiguum]OKH38339.1 hypothetical protein NIES2119_09895 [Phormidium ambiguum IAM M-71]